MQRYEIDNPALITDLRAGISNNTAIPAFFKKVSDNFAHYQPKVQMLKDAIDTGKLVPASADEPDIFADPEAPLLLLYAIEQQLLPYWPGISLFFYLIALAQFTNKQNLRAEHMREQDPKKRYKQQRKVEPIPLTEVVDGVERLREDMVSYIDHVIYLHKLYGIIIDKNKLLAFMISLPAVEKIVLKIEHYGANAGKIDVDTMLRRVKENVPFFRCYEDNVFIMPSASLINYFLRQSGESPMQMMPFFGRQKTATRHQAHVAGKNGIILYLLAVINAMLDAHDLHCGPFPLLAHDIGHTFWANLLTQAERDLINNDLIPFFEMLKTRFSTEDAAAILTKINDYLTDYDLTSITQYYNKSTRLTVYVRRILAGEMNKVANTVNEEAHTVDTLVALRSFVFEKMGQRDAHPFWISCCEMLDTEFKSILRPLGMEKSESDAFNPLPTRHSSFYSSSERAAEAIQKKLKPNEDEVITNNFSSSTGRYC